MNYQANNFKFQIKRKLVVPLIQAENDQLIAHEYKKTLLMKSRSALRFSDSESEEEGSRNLKSKRNSRLENFDNKNAYNSHIDSDNSEHESSENNDSDEGDLGTPPTKKIFSTSLANQSKQHKNNTDSNLNRSEISLSSAPPTPKSIKKRYAGPCISKRQVDAVKTRLIDKFNYCNDYNHANQETTLQTTEINVSPAGLSNISSDQFQWESSSAGSEITFEEHLIENRSTPLPKSPFSGPTRFHYERRTNVKKSNHEKSSHVLPRSPVTFRGTSETLKSINGPQSRKNSESTDSRTPRSSDELRSPRSPRLESFENCPDRSANLGTTTPRSHDGSETDGFFGNEGTLQRRRFFETSIHELSQSLRHGSSHRENQSQGSSVTNQAANLLNNPSRRRGPDATIGSFSRNQQPPQDPPGTSGRSLSGVVTPSSNRRAQEISRNARNRHALRMRSIEGDDDESSVTSEDGKSL